MTASEESDSADAQSRERVALLWKELAAPLRAYFRRRVASEDDAEELLQESFLRVQSGIDSLRDEQRYAAWVQRVASNLLVDSHRAQQPTVALVEEPAVEEEDETLNRRVGGWIADVIEELPAEQREVLRMAELEGRPYREIAEATGLSVSGVKSRVQRGRAVIRGRIHACCELSFDRRGSVIDFRRRARTDSCSGTDGESC